MNIVDVVNVAIYFGAKCDLGDSHPFFNDKWNSIADVIQIIPLTLSRAR